MNPELFPCVIETRLTYDHGGTTGMHCNYPLGLFNSVQHVGQRVEIDRGQYPIAIDLSFRKGWALILDVTGCPMTKILLPDRVQTEYTEYRFYDHGKLYILDFRFDSIGAP